jgi:hypothetical protein
MGESLRPIPATIIHAGIQNRGEIRLEDGTFKMLGVPAQNHPYDLRATDAALEAVGDGAEFEVRIPMSLDTHRDAIGWARTAYLATFAVLGYRYVLRPGFDDLRAEIRDPKRESFTPVTMHVPTAARGIRAVTILTSPEWLAGTVAVQLGPRAILLPPISGDAMGFFDVLRTNEARELLAQPLQVELKDAGWPTAPAHALDWD